MGIVATKPNWRNIADEVDALIRRNNLIFHAGGEFLSTHFEAMEKAKGVPEAGYFRRPLIGLRIPIPGGMTLAAKPGWKAPKKELWASYERQGNDWVKLPEPKLIPASPGSLLVSQIELELVTPGLKCVVWINEDGAKLGKRRVWADQQRNINNIKTIASALYRLIDNPSAVFSEQAEACCNCGKPLTVVTSRLRGIGPECIRYFGDIEAVSAKIKAQFRSLDDDWWAG